MLAIAALLAVTVVLVDLLADEEKLVIGVLIVPVLLTAVTLSPRLTAVAALIAVGAAAVVIVNVPPHPGTSGLLRFLILAIGATACVWGAERGAAVVSRAREAAESEQRYRTILETAEEGVGVLDADGRVVFANNRLGEILGYPVQDMVGRHATDLLGAYGRDDFHSRVARYRAGRRTRHEVRHRRPDGRLVHLSVSGRPLVDDDGRETGLVGFYTDISERKRAESELLRMALHDELTGLANRALFRDRLGHELARRDRTSLAVLLLDLDQFKAVNDALGHALGDRLLQLVADRLSAAVRPFDTVARLGGDEFALVCPDVGSPEAAASLVRRVEESLAEPLVLAGLEMTVTASIGMSLATSPAPDSQSTDSQEMDSRATDSQATDSPEKDAEGLPDQLLREADAAMYAAKRHGRARYEVYDITMGEAASNRLRVVSELRTGLSRDELRLHYQPIIDIGSGSTRGVESLIRWQHPERGLLLPAEFLPAAEESGLLVDVGAWVLRAASEQGAQWQADQWQDDRPLSVSVNLSVRQLLHRDLVDQVRQLLDESGLTPERLVLEVTETALIADLGAASTVLEKLRSLGVRLALDDFGTGYSSLAYLRHLPVDELKLDRSFLVDLDEPQSQSVVSAVIDVAHALDMIVVGEGVERPDQLETLGRLGCDLAQGYLCGRPAVASELRRS